MWIFPLTLGYTNFNFHWCVCVDVNSCDGIDGVFHIHAVVWLKASVDVSSATLENWTWSTISAILMGLATLTVEIEQTKHLRKNMENIRHVISCRYFHTWRGIPTSTKYSHLQWDNATFCGTSLDAYSFPSFPPRSLTLLSTVVPDEGPRLPRLSLTSPIWSSNSWSLSAIEWVGLKPVCMTYPLVN